MNLISITWARNEADILEAFVRYHCTFINAMVIVDHGSDDNSVDILTHLKKEGLPLEIRESHHLDHRQDSTLTALMKEMAHRGYDWVLPLDADEFIKISPGTSLRTILASCNPQTPLSVPWQTYVPTPKDPQGESHPLQRIRYRRSVEIPQYSKVFAPISLLHRDHLTLSYGSHYLSDTTSTPPRPVSCSSHPDLSLAHFPIRSADQLARKAFGGWLGHTLRHDKSPSEGWHWKLFYERCSQQQPISAEELQALAMRYASEQDRAVTLLRDPLPIPDVARLLRYSPQEASPLHVLAHAAERLAERVVSLAQRDHHAPSVGNPVD